MAAPGLKGCLGDLKHRRLVDLQQFGLGLGVAPQGSPQVLAACSFKHLVQVLEGIGLGDRHHEVSPCITDRAFDVALAEADPSHTVAIA